MSNIEKSVYHAAGLIQANLQSQEIMAQAAYLPDTEQVVLRPDEHVRLALYGLQKLWHTGYLVRHHSNVTPENASEEARRITAYRV